MRKDPVKSICYKCGTKAIDVKTISMTKGTNYASFEGWCPKCKARLTWSYQLDDDETETWEFVWVRKTDKKEMSNKQSDYIR